MRFVSGGTSSSSCTAACGSPEHPAAPPAAALASLGCTQALASMSKRKSGALLDEQAQERRAPFASAVQVHKLAAARVRNTADVAVQLSVDESPHDAWHVDVAQHGRSRKRPVRVRAEQFGNNLKRVVHGRPAHVLVVHLGLCRNQDPCHGQRVLLGLADLQQAVQCRLPCRLHRPVHRALGLQQHAQRRHVIAFDRCVDWPIFVDPVHVGLCVQQQTNTFALFHSELRRRIRRRVQRAPLGQPMPVRKSAVWICVGTNSTVQICLGTNSRPRQHCRAAHGVHIHILRIRLKLARLATAPRACQLPRAYFCVDMTLGLQVFVAQHEVGRLY